MLVKDKKEWQSMLYVGNVDVAIPGMMEKTRWTVYSKMNQTRVTGRNYATEEDARRGAAQIYNRIKKELLG